MPSRRLAISDFLEKELPGDGKTECSTPDEVVCVHEHLGRLVVLYSLWWTGWVAWGLGAIIRAMPTLAFIGRVSARLVTLCH
jgi:hypothetical protein